MDNEKSLAKLIGVLVAFLLFGTLCFILLGEKSLWTAFFTTLIVFLSHFKHGINEPVGEQLLILLIVVGSYALLGYFVKLAIEYFLGGEFKESRRRHKTMKVVSKLQDHYIVCGYGRVGKQVAEELFHSKTKFVVIDKDHREASKAVSNNYLVICGDPTLEETLVQANVKNAKVLIACLGEDTDNLFVTLSARFLNPDVYIVARANDEENIPKFEKAGANRVAIPYQIGGYHMATMALRPGVLDFLDVIIDSRHDELEVEEIEVPRLSFIVGKTIAESISKDKTGATILAINRANNTSKINPNGKEMINRGDRLIVMGNKKQLQKVADLVGVD